MATGRLYESATVTLVGGNGTARVGPLTYRETWHPENAHVSANQNPTNQARCNVYVGDAATANNFRDATISGSSGDSTDRINADIVEKGQYIWAVWTGGDNGAVATLTVTGTKDI